MTNVLSNKELITSQRDEILKMLSEFGATLTFSHDITHVVLNDKQISSCHISYELGKHNGYFSLFVSDSAKAYDFPVNGIRSGDFEFVRDGFYLYLRLVKVYCV